MLTHTPSSLVGCSPASRAFWSLASPDTLVVFVHGFKGSALSTWTLFPTGFLTTPEGQVCDVVFFGYDSVKLGAEEAAMHLYEAISKLWLNASNYANKTLTHFKPREVPTTYAKLVVVGHSLGAVVARQALLRHTEENNPWTLAIRLVLFAPAHRGAYAAHLVASRLPSSGTLTAVVGLIAGLKYRSLRDLDPNSEFLRRLEEKSKAVWASAPYHRAHAVIWAEGDVVVENKRFHLDPYARIIPEISHTGVCKPGYHYQVPLEILIAAVQ